MGQGASTPVAPAPVAVVPVKPAAGGDQAKPKPCCVCKDEKAARDECMLFSKSSNAQEECQDLVTNYKICMEGYGFKI